jgi:YegS/Rv2252/BmrU family lipid kinase
LKKLLLIVNPVSGTKRTKQNLLDVCKIFCDADYSVTVHITRHSTDAKSVVKERGKDFDVIVSFGGDGTFNEVVSGALAISYKGAIAFLPGGTTNDTAHTAGIPNNIVKAASVIVNEKGKPMDCGRFQKGRFFTYIASFGAFTDVAYSTDQKMKNFLGHAAYVTEALMKLMELRSYRMQVECDGILYEGDFLFGSVSNSLSIGGVMKLKKTQVDLSDGYHELLLVRSPKTAADIANLSVELFSGNFENKSVLLIRGKNIAFRSKDPIPWCVDGEFAGNHEKVEIQNLPQALLFIRP